MSTAYAHGAFCWTELNARDPLAARVFYAGLFGWTWDEVPLPDGRPVYHMLAGGRLAATIMQLHRHAEAMGTPAHWLSYVAVDDVDAVAKRVVSLGGRLNFAPFAVPGVARMASFYDPTGGLLGLWKVDGHPGAEVPAREPGGLCHHDGFSPEVARAGRFYEALFGWEGGGWEAGAAQASSMPMVRYRLPGAAEDLATLFEIYDQPGPGWRPCFTVADAAAAAERALALGGTIACPPIDLGDRVVANVVDPQGVACGLFQFRSAAPTAPPAPPA